MNDRELLDLAAKAAGAQIKRHESECWESGKASVGYMKDSEFWDPLVDDGDALRLAVKLNLCPKRFGDLIEVVAPKGSSFAIVCEQGIIGGDLMVAYRRGIVRAAAEIGKAMP